MMQRRSAALLGLTTLFFTASCSSDDTNPLPGKVDAGVVATTDASANDAGGTDAQFADAGPPDSGVEPDAGPPDSGEVPSSFPGRLENWCTNQDATFSFFVTSMSAIWALADTPLDDLNGGLGGDFHGVEGADEICQIIGRATGHGDKTWRAFISATDDGAGNPVHAIDRVGAGPWYDANGRLVASGVAGLGGVRPDGDAQAVADLTDECGVPLSTLGDVHDIPTGSDRSGRLAADDLNATCNDWTTSDGSVGSGGGGGPGGLGPVMCGHSFPRRPGTNRGAHWMSDHGLRGCGKGANLTQNGAGTGTCIGCSGGYGGLYCFAQ